MAPQKEHTQLRDPFEGKQVSHFFALKQHMEI